MNSANRPEPDAVAGQVPHGLRVASAVCWRLLVIAAVLYVLGLVLGTLQVVAIPVAVALLLAALLAPVMRQLMRWRLPRGLAAGVSIVAGLAVVGGILYGVVTAFLAGLPDLQAQIEQSVTQLKTWLADGPLHVDRARLDNLAGSLASAISANRAALTSGALGVATTVGEIATGVLLALFTLIFFLYDGRRIWRFLLRGVPGAARAQVDVAGQRAFASLVGYTRAVAVVAVVDAVGIGIGLWAIRVPLVVPLAALVFLGAFVPTVGAVVSGAVAVLVALVTRGLIPAVLVLGVVIAVQQLEGHVLQPLLLGRAVRLHPLAVVLSVATGVVVAGIVGGLLAVPLVAVLNAAVRSLRHHPPRAVHGGPGRPEARGAGRGGLHDAAPAAAAPARSGPRVAGRGAPVSTASMPLRSALLVAVAVVAVLTTLSGCQSPSPRGTAAGGRTAEWRVTVYYTAVESLHHGAPRQVRGCPRRDCTHGHDDLGSYPADFVAAVHDEGTGRITSGPQAGQYLNWSAGVGYWLDSAPRDSTGGALVPFRSAAADGLPMGTEVRLVDCGRQEDGSAVPAAVCDRLRAGRWQVRDQFTPGLGGPRHIDLYIGEESGPDFTDSDLFVTLLDATITTA